MSSRRRFASGILGLTLAAAACSITFGKVPLSPDPSPSPVPTGPGSAAAAMKRLCDAPKIGGGSGMTPEGPTPPAIATVEQQVEAVRNLKYTSHVAVQPLTRAQIDRRLTKSFDKTYPVDFYARRSDAWGTIGVIPAGTSIRDALLAFQTGQVVGFYNPANKKLVYIGDTELSLNERFILAHELTHAIDDQHFGLSRLDTIVARCDDEAFTAALGAVEGSAQFFATQVIMRFPSNAPVGGSGGGSLQGVPPFISRLELWPYTVGMAFIQRLDEQGGTARVNQALTTFPVSTEQIIHPERWPSDTPQPVDIPNLGPALGDGWKDLDVMTVGEVWLQLMLQLRLDTGVASQAATGWDGGIYRAWTDGSHTAIVLRTVWDTSGDAQEFADAMTQWIGNGTAFVHDPVGARVDVGFASDGATLDALGSALP
ncbi:MAG: hypothetical protein ACRDH7_01405 [Actinomycetota bacterium]